MEPIWWLTKDGDMDSWNWSGSMAYRYVGGGNGACSAARRKLCWKPYRDAKRRPVHNSAR